MGLFDDAFSRFDPGAGGGGGFIGGGKGYPPGGGAGKSPLAHLGGEGFSQVGGAAARGRAATILPSLLGMYNQAAGLARQAWTKLDALGGNTRSPEYSQWSQIASLQSQKARELLKLIETFIGHEGLGN